MPASIHAVSFYRFGKNLPPRNDSVKGSRQDTFRFCLPECLATSVYWVEDTLKDPTYV